MLKTIFFALALTSMLFLGGWLCIGKGFPRIPDSRGFDEIGYWGENDKA
jgi:hypothetical protein